MGAWLSIATVRWVNLCFRKLFPAPRKWPMMPRMRIEWLLAVALGLGTQACVIVHERAPRKPAPPAAPPPPKGNGELRVWVKGGSCEIGIDGSAYGNQSSYTRKVAYGAHDVTCGSHKQSVIVNAKEVEVVFDLTKK
jgi:hypothetical protein